MYYRHAHVRPYPFCGEINFQLSSYRQHRTGESPVSYTHLHGRVNGAFLTGKTWNIPENAEKPELTNKKKIQPVTLLDILKDEKAGRYPGGIYHKTQIDLTYNSNHIEGSRLTHEQTRYIFETNTIGIEKDVYKRQTFEQAQQTMQARGKAFRVDKVRQSNKYLFSTLIKCKECGWSFRRTVRTYKNTYVRWVCSGHNGKGAESCPNDVALDEEELIQTLQEYFSNLLESKDVYKRQV